MKTYTTRSGKTSRKKRTPRGFTLVEVMVVLFILLAIAGAGVLTWQGTMERSRLQRAELFIKNMKSPLDLFNLHVGRYPTSAEWPDALLTVPSTLADPSKWAGPYVEESISWLDPWDNQYYYESPGRRSSSRYDLWSMGPDGISDTDDDICSWK